MGRRLLVFAMAGIVGTSINVEAKPGVKWPGDPQFGITARLLEVPTLGGTARLRIVVPPTESLGRSARGVVRITVPAGMDVTKGKLAYSVTPSMGSPSRVGSVEDLSIRFSSQGEFAIHINLEIHEGLNRSEEIDLEMPFKVTSARISYSNGYPTRVECVRDGQRFRYAGRMLIPIDSKESVVAAEIHPPRVLQSRAGTCAGCGYSGETIVSFLAIIDPQGNITEARYVSQAGVPVDVGPSANDAIINAAREALDEWRFAAAEARGRAVAHWIEVEVPVISE